MSDKIKCPSCGKEIKATAKFCGFCATKIEAKPVEKPVEKSVESTEESSSAYVNPLEGMITTGGTRGGSTPTTIVENVEINNEPERIVETPVGKVCTVCGKKMAARAKFCGACGGTLVDDTSSSETAKELPKKDIKSEPPKGYEPPVVEAKAEKKCVSCGAEMGARAKFCGKCGGELIDIKRTTGATGVKGTGVADNIHPDFMPAGDL